MPKNPRPRTVAEDICPDTYSTDTHWPGEVNRQAGTYDEVRKRISRDATLVEKTVIPVVDSSKQPSKNS